MGNMILTNLLFSVIFVGSAGASLSPSFEFSALDREMDAFVEKYQRVPQTGIAIGIVVDGKLAHFRGYGFRNREEKLPVTPDTSFAIGSTTKSFVAAAIATAEKEGLLSWDSPVREVVPEFSLEDPIATSEATLIDLLSHNTGLPRHDLVWYSTPFSSAELLGRIPFLPMTTPAQGYGFRSGKMLYNNLMFLVAGTALERVTGKDWFSAVKERVLDPLGMKQTGKTSSFFEGAAEPAIGYSLEAKLPINARGVAMGPAGYLHSTVNDLARYLAWHLDPEPQNLLGRRELDFLYAPRTDASDERAGEMKYGLAWVDTHIGEERVLWHNGNIDGFSAHLSFIPSRGIGVIVLVNQTSVAALTNPLKVKLDDGSSRTLLPRLILERLMGISAEGPNGISGPRSSTFSAPSFSVARATFLVEKVVSDLFPGLTVNRQEGEMKPWRFLRSMFSLAPNEEVLPERIDSVFVDRGYGTISLVNETEDRKTLDYYGTPFPLRKKSGEENQWFIPKEVMGDEVAVKLYPDSSGAVQKLEVGFEQLSRPIVFSR
jgi:CubicO group peptidase (beta-lactamase class C family)